MTSVYESWEAACAAADAEHHHDYRMVRGGMACPCGDKITPEGRPEPQPRRCPQCGRTQSAEDWDLSAHALMFRFERDLARHQLALIRQVADSLGDRMEPAKRQLLDILDAAGSQA